MSEFKRIPPEQAQALREQGAVVVDVRDPATFAALHIAAPSIWTTIPCTLSSRAPTSMHRPWWSAITAIPARARPPT